MRILLITTGTYGDILPYTLLGEKLRALGNQVSIATPLMSREIVEDRGFSWEQIGSVSRQQYEGLLASLVKSGRQDYFQMMGQRSWQLGNFFRSTNLKTRFQDFLKIADKYDGFVGSLHQADILRHAHYELNRPVVTVVHFFTSVNDNSVIPDLPTLFCRSQHIFGLPDPFQGEYTVSSGIIDVEETTALPQPVTDFLNAGKEPFLVTLGSTKQLANNDLLDKLVDTARETNNRLIILNAHKSMHDQNVLWWNQPVAYSSIHPHCRAAIIHGGMGTTSHSLYHGLPTIFAPTIADQIQTAIKFRTSGLSPGWVTPSTSEETLSHWFDWCSTPEAAAACEKTSQIVRQEPNLDHSAEFVLHQLQTPKRGRLHA